MTQQTKLEFISSGFKAILESEGTKELVRATGEEIRQKANANAGLEDGFSLEVWHGNYGGGRWVGSVTTTDRDSMIAESEEKALSRAVR